MYTREETQQFRRMFIDTGTLPHCEMLLNGMTSYYLGDDALVQPGVVMRNGLRLQLSMADTSKKARVLGRYGVQRQQVISHSGGRMTIFQSAPLTLIG